jgi:exonuclease III
MRRPNLRIIGVDENEDFNVKGQQTDWLHKQDPTFCCLQETHLRDKDRHYLRVNGWKTISKQMVRRNKLE